MSMARHDTEINGYILKGEIITVISGMSASRAKNIKVSFKGDDAFTDGKNYIVIPKIANGAMYPIKDAKVLRGYANHETAHVLYSKIQEYSKFIFSHFSHAVATLITTWPKGKKFVQPTDPVVAKEFWRYCLWKTIENCIEDWRIESELALEWPGSHLNVGQTRQHVVTREHEYLVSGKMDSKRPPEPIFPLLTWKGCIENGYPCSALAQICLELGAEKWPEETEVMNMFWPAVISCKSHEEICAVANDITHELTKRFWQDPQTNPSPQTPPPSQKQPPSAPQNPPPQPPKKDDKKEKSEKPGNKPAKEPPPKPDEDSDGAPGKDEGEGAGPDPSDKSTEDAKDQSKKPQKDKKAKKDPTDGDPESENSPDDGGGAKDPVDPEDDEKSESSSDDDGDEQEGKSGEKPDSSDDQPGPDEAEDKGNGKSSLEAPPEEDDEPDDEDANSEGDPDEESENDGAHGKDAKDDGKEDNPGAPPTEGPGQLGEESDDGDEDGDADGDTAETADPSEDEEMPDGGMTFEPSASPNAQGGSGKKILVQIASAEDFDIDTLDISDIIEIINALTKSAANDPGDRTLVVENISVSDPVAYRDLLTSCGSTAARTADSLRQILMSRSERKHRRFLEDGDLDMSNVVGISLGESTVHHKRSKSPRQKAALALCLDHSGSMMMKEGENEQTRYGMLTQAAAIILNSVSRAKEIVTYIATYTDLPASAGLPSRIQIKVIKDFNQSAEQGKAALGAISLDEEDFGGTPSDIGLLETLRVIKLRPEERKIIVFVTDGEPNSPALTLEAARAIQKSGVLLIGIGIGKQAPKMDIPGWIRIADIDDLPTELLGIVSAILNPANI